MYFALKCIGCIQLYPITLYCNGRHVGASLTIILDAGAASKLNALKFESVASVWEAPCQPGCIGGDQLDLSDIPLNFASSISGSSAGWYTYMTLMITILILEFNQNMKYSSLKNLIFPNRTSVIHVFVSSLKNPDFVCTYMHCNVCVEADKRFSACSRADRAPPHPAFEELRRLGCLSWAHSNTFPTTLHWTVHSEQSCHFIKSGWSIKSVHNAICRGRPRQEDTTRQLRWRRMDEWGRLTALHLLPPLVII